MKNLNNIFLLFLFGGLICCSREELKPTNQNIVGKYIGKYFGGVEIIDIQPDGVFSQRFEIEGITIYKLEGKWSVLNDTSVSFSPFMIPNIRAGQRNDEKVDSGIGKWASDPIRIEFGAWPYFVSKVK